MNQNNPLINPQPGDVVFGMGKTRFVVRRDGGDVWYTVKGQKTQKEKCCFISTWCDWCKKYKVTVITN
jgi:hypothetical protein